jgi:hypothetical protein
MKTTSIAVAAAALATSLIASAAVPSYLLGEQAVPEQAAHTIVITPDTKYVNVTEGEIVKFVINGKSFGWNFDAPVTAPFDLERIAPQGMLDHAVMTYVAHNPEYLD